MHIAFLNPQGNFDPQDRYWAAHHDFGGQLVYVKEVALALGRMGHRVDILTRRFADDTFSGFEARFDAYPDAPNVRIVRLDCGGEGFLPKEDLWSHLGTEWVANIRAFYAGEGRQPHAATTHYGDGGIAGAVWQAQGGPPFTFTGHSLGAFKLERLLGPEDGETLADLDRRYHFARRVAAERVAMNHAGRVITSTRQERMEQYSHCAYCGAVDTEDDSRFAVVPPGVNLRVFDAERRGADDRAVAARVEQALARDILPQRRSLPAIVCSSRLARGKNHLGLAEAFARSPSLRACANLVMVVRGADGLRDRRGLTRGEAEVLDEVVQVVDEAGLEGQVSIFSLESQGEIAAAYRHLAERRSVFALSAHYEPFGLAPLEAAAAGLPVMVTQNGGPSESLRQGETEYGVLVDPFDASSIAEGLERLVGPGNDWDYFQRAGRQRVLDRYTWERTAEGYLQAIEAFLADPAPREGRLPIPDYFSDPSPENDVSLEVLEKAFRIEERCRRDERIAARFATIASPAPSAE
jgi:sucrose-phosphate synthase